MLALPKVDPPADLTIEATPERVERGRYLANHVSVFMDCHSTHDWGSYAGPIVPVTEGAGGEKFEETLPSQRPDKSDAVAYGQYLSTISGCIFCHTLQEKRETG